MSGTYGCHAVDGSAWLLQVVDHGGVKAPRYHKAATDIAHDGRLYDVYVVSKFWVVGRGAPCSRVGGSFFGVGTDSGSRVLCGPRGDTSTARARIGRWIDSLEPVRDSP